MKLKVGGIVLAAGLSRRFGGEKFLLQIGGRPVGRMALEAALASGLAQVVLVTRAELAEALVNEDLRRDGRLRVVINPDPAAGQASSLRLGLVELDPDVTHALFLLADQPLVGSSLINRFLQAAGAGVALAAAGSQGRFCPPALFGQEFFGELTNLRGDQGGREILLRRAGQVVLIEPDDPGDLLDLDRPEDWEAMKAKMARESERG